GMGRWEILCRVVEKYGEMGVRWGVGGEVGGEEVGVVGREGRGGRRRGEGRKKMRGGRWGVRG
ncbi:hypothetical protein MU719_29210, partial [Pseudomonas aeruginosa]|uniref:hypothetical protein n=1 Tax=Pseudomonas aeruginosa TaxID=287 RepID=UPI0024BEE2A5